MQEEQLREALNAHWRASAAGDGNAEHDIYDDDAVCDYPQSGERIIGRNNLQALRSHHPGKPSGFNVKRILGNGDLWITEYIITYEGQPAYTVSIMEFRTVKSCTRHSISQTPSRRQRGGSIGFSRSGDGVLNFVTHRRNVQLCRTPGPKVALFRSQYVLIRALHAVLVLWRRRLYERHRLDRVFRLDCEL